jgi:DNA-binding response OmpR family regulator
VVAVARILIAEDEKAINTLIKKNLELVGHKCHAVFDGEAALNELNNNIYDLILLDIMMPKMDGFAVVKELPHDTPVIFLSARSAVEDRIKGLKLGADDYITKPFSLSVLRARVEAIIRRLDKSGSHIIRSGRFRVDTDLCKLYKDDTEIPVSATEYRIVRHFMANAGRILSKEQLFAALWDNQGNFVDENTLPVNISRLRAKIEEDPKTPKVIKTVHGMGYFWEG